MPLPAGNDGSASSGRPPNEPPMRASDAERAATVRVLQDALARGLLTPDEASERMATAFATVHRQDLGPLTADLPPAASGPTAPGWDALALMAVAQLRSSLTSPATGRLRPARIAVALLVALLLVVAIGSMFGELLGGGGHYHGDFGDR